MIIARRATRISILSLMLLLASTLLGSSAALGQNGEPDTRPDIIVIYLDDVNPHDGRLWSDPRRTPAMAKLFVETATTFEMSIVETPLCCPGRAGILTGLHTSNHGVDANDVALFDPRVTVATELQGAGYQTFYVGKYMNMLRTRVPRNKVGRYAKGWDEFDVVYEDNGKWYDYDLWTRSGIKKKGRAPKDHITLMTERRASRYIRQASTEAPLFAFLSIFHTHVTNRPLEKYRDARRCRSIKPWSPPNFNEADVSDKPAYIRERAPLRRKTWPMRRYCEEMLGVDDMVARMVKIQKARGRFENTLFIFTADNGVAWGAHRLGQVKGVPYATRVPLAMSWPARWGTSARSIETPVSNIDLAPTLCEIAGCIMGPFPDGPETSDGLSLLALLDGDVEDLDRDALREQSGPDGWPPQFWAIRTTPRSALGQWHYIEYDTGERELYDSVADPWELQNLAADPAYAETVAALAARLRVEFPGLPSDSPGDLASDRAAPREQ
ncbi:MAG: sulfatase-like hydrolase/transferase [Chloroflexota bacterium]